MNKTSDKDLIAAKTRLTNLQADKVQMKLDIMHKEYVSMKAITKQWTEQVGRVKQRLLALPTRMAGMMAGVSMSATEIENLMSQMMTEVLNELADMPEWSE